MSYILLNEVYREMYTDLANFIFLLFNTKLHCLNFVGKKFEYLSISLVVHMLYVFLQVYEFQNSSFDEPYCNCACSVMRTKTS